MGGFVQNVGQLTKKGGKDGQMFVCFVLELEGAKHSPDGTLTRVKSPK